MARPLELKLSMVAMVAVACSPDITALLHHAIATFTAFFPTANANKRFIEKLHKTVAILNVHVH